jgi:hypothetical protein
MAQDFSGGVGGGQKPKMQGHMDELRKPAMKAPGVKQPNEKGGAQEETHTITKNADGSVSTGDGEHHPDHLHALAHVAHKMTGGDKHHITHHDGMSLHSHGIHEDGQHEETQEHGSAEEAGEGLKQFMGADEQAEQGQGQEQEPEPAPLGGM